MACVGIMKGIGGLRQWLSEESPNCGFDAAESFRVSGNA